MPRPGRSGPSRPRPGRWQAAAHQVAEKQVRVGPAQQPRRPASFGVARPGHHPAKAVLPGRQQWITGCTLEDDVGGRPWRGRDVPRQVGETAEWDSRQDFSQRAEPGHDVTLDNPWFEGLAGFLEEDLRYVLHAIALVKAAVAPAGHLLQECGIAKG